jgi:multidrug efflux system outer membrane protein
MTTLCLVVAAGLASGCASVGPDYRRPEMSPPDAFRDAVNTQTAHSLADMPWWEVFRDEALQALIRDAIAHNLDLRIAIARVQEARALSRVARSFLYPDVGLSAGYTGNQGSRHAQPPGAEPDTDRTYNNTSVEVVTSWELDLFGRIRRDTEAAVARYLSTEEGRRAVLIALVSDVASS